MYYKVFKHSANCQYIYDCYRLEAQTEKEALLKVKDKTGVIGDYAMKNNGNWNHPHIIDLD